MVKWVSLLFVLLFLSSVSAMTLCQEQTDIDDIPCLGLTTIVNCTGNISVTNINTSQQYNLTTTLVGSYIYNFTFNFTQSSYSLIDCQNSTATIVVGDFEGDKLWKLAVVLAMVGAAFIYVLIGKFLFENNNWLVKSSLYISSLLIFLIAIQSSLLTSPDAKIISLMNTSVTVTIVLILVFFLYLFIYYLINIIKAVKEVREEKKSEL